MNTQNEKTFNCIAVTKKGNFDVIIKVWEEILEDGELFTGSFANRSWKNESYVIIEGEQFKINEYYEDRVRSWAVANKYGISQIATLLCDCSEVKIYINSIEDERRAKMIEWEEEARISEMIHNL
jgi:hypothetical protein